MGDYFHADFYGFVIDSEQGLSFAGQEIGLHPKEFNLLLTLVKHAGRRISKEELIAEVWNRDNVSDESISRCVSILKSALRRANPGAEALIRTEYGQGYRFIGHIGKPASFVNEEHFFLLINASQNLVTLKDGHGRWQIANHTALSLYGLHGKPWQGKTNAELAAICQPHDPECLEICGRSDEQAWSSRQAYYIEEFALPCNGNHAGKRFFEITKTPSFEADGSRKALITFGQDISDRLESERQARLTSRVLADSDEAVLISDAENNIVYINEAFTRITGYTLPDVAGQNPRMLSAHRHDQEFYRNMWHHIVQEGTWHGEIWDRRKNGEVYPKWLNISCVHDNNGKVCNYIGIFSDISKRKADEARLAFLAYHDPLTKLPNRLLLQDRFRQATGAVNRREGGMLALLFLDLDRFKAVNDNLGHETGDQLLATVAKRLQACVRKVDTVSRLGGDEFVLLLTDVPNSHAASEVAQKIIDYLAENIEAPPHKLKISASIGLALYPDDGEDFDTLLKLADTAMYHAKECGRGTYRFFTDKMNIEAMERLKMRHGLAEAIDKREFLLHYQPQFDLQSGELIGLEALIRWNHPDSELLYPGKFIPVAEETGQIVAIGEWVVGEICRQINAWQAQGLQVPKIALNLSMAQFKRSNVSTMLTELTEQYGIEPMQMELELAESFMQQDVSALLNILEDLKKLQFGLAIDDFGTGFSNLTYLKCLPIDKLKIDQALIRNIEIDHFDLAIVRTVIQLAKGLGLRTIAEGVETQEQLDILLGEGADEAQGYYFCRPLPPQAITSYLKTGVRAIG